MKTTSLILLLSLSLTSCAWFKSEAKVVETDAIDCAKAQVTAAESGTSLIQAVLDIGTALSALSGITDAEVAALVAKYSEPVVACVTNDIEKAFTTQTPTTGSASTAEALPEDSIAEEAQKLIQKKGWKFK